MLEPETTVEEEEEEEEVGEVDEEQVRVIIIRIEI